MRRARTYVRDTEQTRSDDRPVASLIYIGSGCAASALRGGTLRAPGRAIGSRGGGGGVAAAAGVL